MARHTQRSGQGFAGLIFYVPDKTGRRKIRGMYGHGVQRCWAPDYEGLSNGRCWHGYRGEAGVAASVARPQRAVLSCGDLAWNWNSVWTGAGAAPAEDGCKRGVEGRRQRRNRKQVWNASRKGARGVPDGALRRAARRSGADDPQRDEVVQHADRGEYSERADDAGESAGSEVCEAGKLGRVSRESGEAAEGIAGRGHGGRGVATAARELDSVWRG